MKNICMFLLLISAVASKTVPLSPEMFDQPSSEHLARIESYMNARAMGVDSPNGIYGAHNPIASALGD